MNLTSKIGDFDHFNFIRMAQKVLFENDYQRKLLLWDAIGMSGCSEAGNISEVLLDQVTQLEM